MKRLALCIYLVLFNLFIFDHTWATPSEIYDYGGAIEDLESEGNARLLSSATIGELRGLIFGQNWEVRQQHMENLHQELRAERNPARKRLLLQEMLKFIAGYYDGTDPIKHRENEIILSALGKFVLIHRTSVGVQVTQFMADFLTRIFNQSSSDFIDSIDSITEEIDLGLRRRVLETFAELLLAAESTHRRIINQKITLIGEGLTNIHKKREGRPILRQQLDGLTLLGSSTDVASERLADTFRPILLSDEYNERGMMSYRRAIAPRELNAYSGLYEAMSTLARIAVTTQIDLSVFSLDFYQEMSGQSNIERSPLSSLWPTFEKLVIEWIEWRERFARQLTEGGSTMIYLSNVTTTEAMDTHHLQRNMMSRALDDIIWPDNDANFRRSREQILAHLTIVRPTESSSTRAQMMTEVITPTERQGWLRRFSNAFRRSPRPPGR